MIPPLPAANPGRTRICDSSVRPSVHVTKNPDVDISALCINPLQNATVAEAAVTPGHSLTVAFERKMRGTGDDCARQVVAFMDFSVNCFGFLSDFLSDPGFPGVRSMGPVL